MYRIILLALASLFVLAPPVSAKEFVFTAIPDEDETRLQARFDKVALYLQRRLGIAVKFVPVKSYAASVTAFANDQVQMAWFGGLSGVRARQKVPGSRALAQGVEDRRFVTYFIAHAVTGLVENGKFPTGIAGKTFIFGSKGSTSGRLMPEFYIRRHFGKAPRRVFRRVGFSGDHSKTIALVQSGAYLVGAVNFKVWENEKKAGKIDPSKARIIWRTPPYPDYNWTVRGDVERFYGQGFIGRLQQALVEMKDRELLKSFPRKGFIPAKNSDYLPILKIGKKIGLLD